MLDVIEALAGMVSSMLEFPMAGFLGGLVPAAGSEAGKQVATAVGTGLDNLGSLCSQAGLDRWELLGLAVLSAITVYRKELSSNSVYNGEEHPQVVSVVVHAEGCQAAAGRSGDSDRRAPTVATPCVCARIQARQRQRASAARRVRESVDERKLRRLVEGRMRSLDLPVHHLNQLRASVDASWSSFSTAWEARRARGSGAGSVRECSGEEGEARRRAREDFVMPPCSHPHACSYGKPRCSRESAEERGRETPPEGNSRGEGEECVECAALAAAHLAAAAILRNGDGTLGLLEVDDVFASSALGSLPEDALSKSLGFLPPRDLLTMGQVSTGARDAADSDLVWREAWVGRFGSMWESSMCRGAARRWHLHGWDPRSSSVPQGWKVFFSEFEATWLEWVAAGQNSESGCLVGLHGRLYDVTAFMHQHPGSPETLMDNAGADATEFFEDVGHSFVARDLMKSLDCLQPGSATPPSPGAQVGEARGEMCILTSTTERLRRGRALARLEAGAVLAAGGQEFLCEDCEGAFEPTDLDGDGGAGRERRAVCSHASGALRVFYSPLRAEWGAFYSCCRKHALVSC